MRDRRTRTLRKTRRQPGPIRSIRRASSSRPTTAPSGSVPGSKAGYTLTQLRDRFLAPDWHPADYPAMPEIVARGRKPDVFACGFCHRADGPGGPENANLTGLPRAYIVRQMADFKSGARNSVGAGTATRCA